MCTLTGFRIRCCGVFVLFADEDYIRRVYLKKAEIEVGKFRKIAVVDLFAHGKPKSTVDLQLVEQAEHVVTTLMDKFHGQITFFDDAPLVMTAEKKNAIDEAKKRMQRLAKEKEARLKKRYLRKKELQDKRAKIREANLREARARKIKMQLEQKRLRAKKAEDAKQKRLLRRKRTRDIKIRVAEETTAKAAKIQRVALKTLSDQHKAVIDDLSGQHKAVIDDLQRQQQKKTDALQKEIADLKKMLEDSNRRAEHQKLLSTIEALKHEVQFLRRGQREAPPKPAPKESSVPDAPKTAPKKPASKVVVDDNSVSVLARALQRVNSVGSSSSSSSGALTPLDPELGTPYDPLGPVCAPPMRRSTGMRMTQLGGGYDYYTRQIMSRSLPTRRRLDYHTPPNYGGFDTYY